MNIAKVFGITLFVLIFVIFGVIGAADYEDALLMDKIYKDDVCNGVHPNYKNIEVVCK